MPDTDLATAVRAAVSAERKRCAAVARSFPRSYPNRLGDIRMEIAAAIEAEPSLKSVTNKED